MDLGDTVYADILRPDVVGTRLLQWEADMMFPQKVEGSAARAAWGGRERAQSRAVTFPTSSIGQRVRP